MDSLNMEALQGTITELVSTWGIKVVGALAHTTWKIYLVGGQISGNRYAVKLRSGLAKLSGGRQDAVVIVVSTLDQQTLQPSADVLAACLNDLESPVAYADRLSRGGAE